MTMGVADCRLSEYNHKKLLQAFKKVGIWFPEIDETEVFVRTLHAMERLSRMKRWGR